MASKTAESSEMPVVLKGIIFDIDGTLADSWKLGYDATKVVLENNKESYPVAGEFNEEIYHACTRYCTPERLARHVGLFPDVDGDKYQQVGDKLAKEFDDLYVGLVDSNTAGFFKGIQDMLDAIPSSNGSGSAKLGVLTNAAVAYAHAVLKANNVHDRFLSIHGADDVPKPKPSPEGLLLCCKDLELKPDECIYIGDSPSDGEAAKAAGMPSIGVTWGSHSEESLKNAPFGEYCSTPEALTSSLLSKLGIMQSV